MKIAVLFPGQGSQFIGMGQEFINDNPVPGELLKQAEDACGFSLGRLIAEGPMEELTRNSRLQPAITVTNMICWEAIKAKLGELQVGCFAGHSLGEYSALYAAGVVSAEDCLRLVAKRGDLMEREGRANPGGMRAVVGLEIGEVEDILAGYAGPGVVTAANHNTPQQIVISGSIEALDSVTPLAEAKGAKVIALNVSVANHSPLVANAVPDFARFMEDIVFAAPVTPVYFNVTGKTADDPGTIKEIMGRQIISRVHWCDIITAMIDDGVDTFIEVGPKNILKGMMRKLVPKGIKVNVLQFDTPATLDACLEKLA